MALELRVASFERGFTDNYVNGPRNAGQKFDNLLLSRNRKPFTRPGSELFDSTLSLLPSSNQRVQYLKSFQNKLYEFSGDEIFYRDGTAKELVGPVDSNDAFGDVGVPATARNSTTQWQNHLYATIDTYSRPRKIYEDENGTPQIRTAGLPSPGDVRGLSTAISLANSLKATLNAHMADLAEHTSADTAVSEADATDLDSLIVLVNAIKDRYVSHEDDAHQSGGGSFHQAQISTATALLASEDNVSTLTQAINQITNIKANYNTHDNDSTAHTTGATHQESTADATKDFTITPESTDGNSYIYGLAYKYQYMVGSVVYIDRSPIHEVTVTNAGDFSTSSNGNDLSNIPELTNDAFGTKEAWDTDNIEVEIYRTENNGTILKLASEISNGSTTYEDDTPDPSLGINAYITGGVLNNDPPPLAKYITQVNDIVWYANVKEGSEEKSFRVRQSVQLDPDSAPETFVTDLDEAITGIGKVNIFPIVFTRNKVYRLEGFVDNLGRGFVKKRLVDDTVGCVSHNGIVQVKDGLYFPAVDGFYFTNGFKTTKITNHLNSTYSDIVGNATLESRIYGVFDPRSELVYWAVSETEAETDNNQIWVHDPSWGVPNGQGTFTTWSSGANFEPSALEIIDGDLIRSGSRGYTFRHKDTLFTDPIIDVNATPSTWSTKAVVYDYTSPAFAFGSEFRRKYVTRLLTVLKSVTNVSIQPQSINDDSGATRNLKEFRNRSVFEWGDPFFTWGDDSFVWNAPGTATAIRRFPRDSLRCTLKQVRYTNSTSVVRNGDQLGSVTIDDVAKTITLTSGEIWQTDIVGFLFNLDSDTVNSFEILERNSDTVITVLDASGFLSSQSTTAYTITGFVKGERFHLEGYTILFDYFGTSHTAFNVGDDGSNA